MSSNKHTTDTSFNTGHKGHSHLDE